MKPYPFPRKELHDVHADTISMENFEQLLNLSRNILEMVALGKDTNEILADLCRTSEAMLPDSVASIMLYDDTRSFLKVRSAPSIPESAVSALNGLVPGPEAASCGTAMFTKKPVYVVNTLTDPRWRELRDLAREFNINACWSVPIKTETQQVIGSFSLSSFKSCAPSDIHKRLLKTASSLAGIILKKESQDQRLSMASIAFENMSEGIVITDAHHKIVEVNDAFTRITGYQQIEVLGKKTSILSSGKHDQKFYKELWRCMKINGSWSGEIWNRRKSGEVYPQWLSLKAIKDNRGKDVNFIAVMADLSSVIASEKRVWEISNYDSLTGLPNRQYFTRQIEESLELAKKYNQKIALVSVDIDNFKRINDLSGHGVGDHILEQTARRLGYSVRKRDVVARIGGDEFAMLVHSVKDIGDIEKVSAKLKGAFDATFKVGDQEMILTPSIGVSLFPDDADSAAALMKQSETALHEAKQLGKNQIAFYSPKQTELIREKIEIENDLYRAVEKAQFFVQYQPLIEVKTGRVAGAEALVRWQHPEKGLIPPDKFIKVAEDNGLIKELGAWVLESVCKQGVIWQQENLPLIKLSVNLSGHQLDPGCAGKIGELIESTGFHPACLELEVTETSLMEKGSSAVNELFLIRDLGITLAMDDFGTGHSSLSQLKLLPIQKLKIDRSFVKDLPGDTEDAAVTRAIIGMARALGMQVTAEGVETEEQVKLLTEEGCDIFQGYYFSRPLMAEDFSAYLKKMNCR